jgi:hypothetical protein
MNLFQTGIFFCGSLNLFYRDKIFGIFLYESRKRRHTQRLIRYIM